MRYLFVAGLLLVTAQLAFAQEQCTPEKREDAFYAAIDFLSKSPKGDTRAFEERSLIVADAHRHWVHGDCTSYFAYLTRNRKTTASASKSPN